MLPLQNDMFDKEIDNGQAKAKNNLTDRVYKVVYINGNFKKRKIIPYKQSILLYVMYHADMMN